MTEIKYETSVGAPFKKEKAQTYGEEIARLTKKHNGIKPKQIVESAKDENSPLHDYFDWSDNTAAKKWRIQQARDLSNHIVEVPYFSRDAKPVRSFVSVMNEGENVYQPLKVVLETPDYRSQEWSRLISLLENTTSRVKLFDPNK